MAIKLGINGLGRIGRLAFRIAAQNPAVEIVQVNDPAGPASMFAHLLMFDSVHGKWNCDMTATENALYFEEREVKFSAQKELEKVDWSGCDIVLECSGKFKTVAALQPYLQQGVKRVVVSSPVKEAGALNVVMGVNDHLFNPAQHQIVTAASCTTNCLAPVVKVLMDKVGIKHGSITTIHDITNTQSILDAPHKDLRRARACGESLIPTSTGSATAIVEIFPELKGKIDGHAVRVPLANASLTDCVFEVNRETSVTEVNQWLKEAAEGELQGILGYEERPLVSVDYRTDPRSSIIDALSTKVINGTHVKIYAWYDNEWGYANRAVELARKVAQG
ncbi:MAG: glyceraldehyde-3-phosphate dehydrogenase, type I [Idiomarinaceae bacterium HL-53]|nr:MAG: glyceraldehyde-3-phosphate dehydrogenase, type I [Idiomarinaceae bacterium HL-53]CUS47816.1 glyceraldehyde 3-phosphate dehydrogenase [Idiomarinaceae bacterium HL-53]